MELYRKHRPKELADVIGQPSTIKMLDDTTLEVEISKKFSLNALFEHFQKNKIEIASIKRRSTRLEELFLDLIDKGKNGP